MSLLIELPWGPRASQAAELVLLGKCIAGIVSVYVRTGRVRRVAGMGVKRMTRRGPVHCELR